MKRTEKIKKNVKGITLIALVVTIIVLLILAGVAINLTIGNNGLFSRAQNAANVWEIATKSEENEITNFIDLYDSKLTELGLEGEKQRKEFNFLIEDAYGETVELIAYEGDTWITWLEDVKAGIHSHKGVLDYGLLDGFIKSYYEGSPWEDKVFYYQSNMASGAYINYYDSDKICHRVGYSDKINSDIKYELYAA